MSAKVRCPECHVAAQVPPALLGRKVACKGCGARFVAEALEGDSASAESAGGAVTVIARREGAARAGAAKAPVVKALWPALAALAFLLPVLGAGSFAAFMWDGGGRGP